MRYLRALLLPCLLLPASCGTVINCIDARGPEVFGGLRTDAELFGAVVESRSPRPWWFFPLWTGYFLVDLPLSAGADLAVLPYAGLRALTWGKPVGAGDQAAAAR